MIMSKEILIGIALFAVCSCGTPKETSTLQQSKDTDLGLDSLEQARIKRIDSATVIQPSKEIKSQKITSPPKKVQKKKS